MKTRSPKSGLNQVRRHRRRGEYREALCRVQKLLDEWPDLPGLLVLRAELIQLQDEDGPDLKEVKESLERAMVLDNESVSARVELGHFLFAVEDNARDALKEFRYAATLSRTQLIEALSGQIEALHELGRDQDALGCFKELLWLQDSDSKTKEPQALITALKSFVNGS